MLQTLKKIKIQKNFYGINSRKLWFLMNKFSSKNIVKKFIKSKKMISISPLEMTVN